MKKYYSQGAITVLALFMAGSVSAQQLYVYPNKGQTAKQQQKDTQECYQSAIVAVGYDPARVQHSSGPAPSSSDTSVGRGVARGAVGGAILGEIGGGSHTGDAAAVGAIFGGIRSSRKKQQEEEQRQQYYQQQNAQNAQAQANFNRAYSACLESRGYTAK
jgi:hypothetical protein